MGTAFGTGFPPSSFSLSVIDLISFASRAFKSLNCVVNILYLIPSSRTSFACFKYKTLGLFLASFIFFINT